MTDTEKTGKHQLPTDGTMLHHRGMEHASGMPERGLDDLRLRYDYRLAPIRFPVVAGADSRAHHGISHVGAVAPHDEREANIAVGYPAGSIECRILSSGFRFWDCGMGPHLGRRGMGHVAAGNGG